MTETANDKLRRLCLESLYEFHEGMPEGCYSVDEECKSVRWWKRGEHWACGRCQMYFDPLIEDEHAMQLVKAHSLHIDQRPGKVVSVQDPNFQYIVERRDCDLNLAITELVAQMQSARTAP